MKYIPYVTKESYDQQQFDFVSIGPKGRIQKRVLYAKLPGRQDAYEIAFGDVKENDEIDIFSNTNNNDTYKILATVAQTLSRFFQRYPDSEISFEATTIARTRLYRMMISRNLTEFKKSFHIMVRVNGKWKTFQKTDDCDAFSIEKKKY